MSKNAKTIKTSLRAATAALKEKNFAEASRQCLIVLRLEPRNYTALLYMGAVNEGLEDNSQAEDYYKQSIEADPTQTAAYSGIMKFYLKLGTSKQKELLDVYTEYASLLQKKDESMKWIGIMLKIAELLASMSNTDQAIETMESVISILDKVEMTNEKKIDLYVRVCKYYLSQKDVQAVAVMNLETITLFCYDLKIQCFRELVRLSFDENLLETKKDEDQKSIVSSCAGYALLLRNWFFLSKDTKLLLEAIALSKQLLNLNNEDDQSLSILFEALDEDNNGLDDERMTILNQVANCSRCSYSLVAQGLVEGNFESLKTGIVKNKTAISGYITLACSLENKDKTSILLRQAFGNVKMIPRFSSLSRRVREIEYLIWQMDLDSKTTPARLEKAITNIKNFDIEILKGSPKFLILSAVSVLSDKGFAAFLEKEFMKAKEYYDEAIDLIGNSEKESFTNKEIALVRSRLGILFWTIGNDKEEYRINREYCFTNLLTSAKLHAFSPTFEYLGHYYLEIGKDENRAISCYKKALSLDHSCDSGRILSDLYIANAKLEEAHEIHLQICERIGTHCSWVWFRAGLHFLRAGNYSECVKSLQTALRVDSDIPEIWECLAEAYCCLGRYMAGLKAFQRSCSLRTENDSLKAVSMVRCGEILTILNLHDDAIAEFDSSLSLNPTYKPAFLGRASVQINKSKALYEQGRIAASVDLSWVALQSLLTAFVDSTVEENSDSLEAYFGKLVGDICCTFGQSPPHLLHALSENLSALLKEMIPARLSDGQDIDYEGDLCCLFFSLGEAAYRLSILSTKEVHMIDLKHDLAITLCKHSVIANDEGKKEKLLEEAFEISKQCVEENQSNSRCWEILGIIAAYRKNNDLSQHSFIKCLHLNIQNAQAWTNLGALYFEAESLDLSNKAFLQAQTHEPSYNPASVGRALISENTTKDSAAISEMYRHAIVNDFQIEGNQGFAYAIFKNWHEKQTSLSLFRDKKLLHQAIASLEIYLMRNTLDGSSYNMHGLLLECAGFYTAASHSFERAKILLKDDKEAFFKVSCNLGRVLIEIERFADAITELNSVRENGHADLYSLCGLGYALYLCGSQTENAILVYNSILQHADATDEQKSDVYLILGIIYFVQVKDLQNARQHLFKCIEVNPNHVRGIFTLAAFGLLSNEVQITISAMATFKQLSLPNSNQIDIREEQNSALLASCLKILQGCPSEAVGSLSSAVHRVGFVDYKVWSDLANFIFDRSPEKITSAYSCLNTSFLLASSTGIACDEIATIASSKSLCLLGSGSFTTKNRKVFKEDVSASIETAANALRQAQRSVHLDPTSIEGWSCLGACNVSLSLQLSHIDQEKSQAHTIAAMKIFDFVRCRSQENLARLKADETSNILTKSRIKQVERIQQWASIALCETLLAIGSNLDLTQREPYLQQIEQLCQSLQHLSVNVGFLSEVYRIMARCSILYQKEFSVTIAFYKQALQSNSSDVNLLQEIAEFYLVNMKYEAAELCYRNCLSLTQSIPMKMVILLRLSLLCTLANKDAVAKEALDEIFKIQPRYPPALLLMGLHFYFLNDYKQSRRYLQYAIGCTESNSMIYGLSAILLCDVHIQRKDLKSAQDVFQNVDGQFSASPYAAKFEEMKQKISAAQ